MTHSPIRMIDSLIADQERRHAWLFEAGEKLRRERMEETLREMIMGGSSGSREPSPKGLGPTGFDPGRIRCFWCGKFTTPSKARFHFIPDNEFGPEELWWECRDSCERQSKKESA